MGGGFCAWPNPDMSNASYQNSRVKEIDGLAFQPLGSVRALINWDFGLPTEQQCLATKRSSSVAHQKWTYPFLKNF